MIVDCIYILGLERLKEQKDAVIRRLKALGINESNQKIVWWKAVDGSKEFPFSEEIYKAEDNQKKHEYIKKMNDKLKELNYLSKNIPYPMKPGQIGCYASFMNIIKDARKNKYKNIIYLEDDVLFTEDFIKQINFTKTLDKDIVYLGSHHEYWNQLYKKDQSAYYRCPSKRIDDKLIEYPVGCLAKDIEDRDNSFLGTFGMFIRDTAYDIILKYAYPMRYAVDVYIGKLYYNDLISNIHLKNPIVYVDYSNAISQTSGLNYKGQKYIH